MVNKLKVKNKQMERMGINKTKTGDYQYIQKNNRNINNNVIADPKEMQKGIEQIMQTND